MCTQWNSGPFVTIPLKQFTTHGQQHITHYPSSTWAERAFCRVCGTHLYYHAHQPEFYHFNAALFPIASTNTKVTLEIFSDKKPEYYDFLRIDSQKMTEEDVLEFMNKTYSK